MNREGLPGVPEFKGKIKPSKESKIPRGEFPNDTHGKFDLGNADSVGKNSRIEAEIDREITPEAAADLKVARQEMENADWEAKLAAARKKIEDEGVDVDVSDLN